MTNKNNKTGIRLVFYFLGFLIMTLGVAVSIKPGLGVSPNSSVPYTLTVVFGIELGLATTIVSIVAALLQIPILREDFKMTHLLQIPVSVVFGFFMTSCVKFVNFIPNPSGFVIKIVLMLISTVIVAIGVFMYLSAGYIPLPTEGLVLAIAQVTKVKFGTMKVIGDVTMVLISLVMCLVKIHSFGSIGLGTIVSALLVGTEVKFITGKVGNKVKELLGK